MTKKMCRTIIVLASMLFVANFALALPVLAEDKVNNLWGNDTLKRDIKDNSGLPSNVNDPRTVAANVIRYILGFLGILAVVIILYAGFKWMTSGGSEEKVGESKKMLIAGVIGLVIILSAYALADFVITQIFNAANG